MFVGSNWLQSLPDDFHELRIDGYLALDENQLQSLPSGFGNMHVGSYLTLYQNQLHCLPDDIQDFRIGGDLFLGQNQLSRYPIGENQMSLTKMNFPNVIGQISFEAMGKAIQ